MKNSAATENMPVLSRASEPRRSPRFPFISLQEAVRRARRLREAFPGAADGEPLSKSQLRSAWRMGPTSSALNQTVAALHQYGLVKPLQWPRDAQRSIELTPRATSIMDNVDAAERLAEIRAAALTPKIFGRLWAAFGAARGVEPALLIDFLTNAQKVGPAVFNRKAARTVSDLYSANLEYADLGDAPTAVAVPVPQLIGSAKSQSGTFDDGATAWVEEQFPDDDGNLIFIRYRGPPNRKIYQCIRDQFEFRLERMKRDVQK